MQSYSFNPKTFTLSLFLFPFWKHLQLAKD